MRPEAKDSRASGPAGQALCIRSWLAVLLGRVASQPETLLGRALERARIDLAPGKPQPTAGRLLLATLAAVAGSLLADALLIAIGTAVWPATRGYPHFQFGDYAKLTIVGVIIACAAWPVVTRITNSPRWLFLRMAVVVTLVLWLPDLYILAKGQPAQAVAVLMAMHLAIALLTYSVLVRVAAVPERVLQHSTP